MSWTWGTSRPLLSGQDHGEAAWRHRELLGRRLSEPGWSTGPERNSVLVLNFNSIQLTFFPYPYSRSWSLFVTVWTRPVQTHPLSSVTALQLANAAGKRLCLFLSCSLRVSCCLHTHRLEGHSLPRSPRNIPRAGQATRQCRPRVCVCGPSGHIPSMARTCVPWYLVRTSSPPSS